MGWAAVAPRAEYRRLESSRILKPVDEAPVWSAPCFFTAKEARGKKLPAGFVWWGLAPAFRKAGFKEALRRSKNRPIMRKRL